MGIITGMDGDGDGMGTTGGEEDCMGALCVSAVRGGMDVGGTEAGILST